MLRIIISFLFTLMLFNFTTSNAIANPVMQVANQDAAWYTPALHSLWEQGLVEDFNEFDQQRGISGFDFINLMVKALCGPESDSDSLEQASNLGWIGPERHENLKNALRRGDMVLIALRALNKISSPDNIWQVTPPKDMPPEDVLTGYVRRAMAEGLVAGYPDGTFRPEQKVTYKEAMVMIERLINLARPENILPDDFVYLDDIIPDAVYEIRYYGENNFVGTRIDGYLVHRTILSEPAANALKQVQQELKRDGLGLKIYDAYRPQRAVNHFVRWARDTEDTKMKEEYYPEVDKADLFKLGYIAAKSGHSRGSTVDLTIIQLATGEELDMGSTFDFFGPISHYDTRLITEEQRQNRHLLLEVMKKYGFNPYPEEWWHFTLDNEPYPQEYFDFPIQ